eukprot:CAMPEP_0176445692 /NCGR_PEP_ID=MMETSP0127-20121128/23863_1 /TAXON_ID=938130 /ORGANISM="Platyophrya macrostoma, Strain WH" /LENGTH=983 /DNA_ID=CAMNT_0017831547 /DNA_START=80 /DNA_END=3031 /DNA_ORIENTATION=+
MAGRYNYKIGNKTYTTDQNLTVHVVAHTHCDPGWLKTVDEYYFGRNNSIQWAGVQYILDAVVDELDLYPDRRFMYVEMAFFSRWWREQDQNTKDMVQAMVADRRLEFIGGGWVMHDEATPYYEDKLDNMAVGHQFLLEEFNYTPSIGWQIDPFGHSSTTANFFAKTGFDGMWFARVDSQDKLKRLTEKSMEMIWQPTTSQGEESRIFAAVNYAHYSAPDGFCFDIIQCGDEPIADDPDLEGYNVEAKVQQITNYFRSMSANYQGDHLLHTWGDDFNFQAAAAYFKNLDKLIKATNARFDQYGVNMIFSTPTTYLQAINEQNLTYPIKSDDFFPYRDNPNGFWTGYFTSRVSQKGYTRDSGRDFQNIRRLVSHKLLQNESNYLANNIKNVVQAIRNAEENRGLLQHHDAVSGTAKQHVKEDYVYLMEKTMNALHDVVVNPVFQEETQAKLGLNVSYTKCLLNTTADACNVTQGLLNKQSVLVAVYNPLKNDRDQIVRIKVPTTKVQVYSLNNQSGQVKLDTDVICANQTNLADCDLFFFDHFAGSTTGYYLLAPSTQSNQIHSLSAIDSHAVMKTVHISANRSLTVVRDLSTFVLKDGDQEHPFRVKINYYPSFCQSGQQNSGAYIFRPAANAINQSIPYTSLGSAQVFSGKVVSQVSLISDEVIVNMRFEVQQSSTPGFDLETFVNSISVADGVGKEIVVIVESSEINNNQVFYTDSNGLEMQERVLNYRPTWNFTTGQGSSGNYYPITNAISIQDNTTGLRATLLTDRSHGATSLQNGQLEVMLHRRLICDDGRGVGEPLNETDWDGQGLRQWFSNRLVFGNDSDAQRTAQFHLDQPNMVLLAQYPQTSIEKIVMSSHPHVNVHSAFRVERMLEAVNNDVLPDNVKITYKPHNATDYTIWIHNLNEANVTVPVAALSELPNQTVTLSELSLSGNQLRSVMLQKKMTWNGVQPSTAGVYSPGDDQIIFRALEIRCFHLTVTSN